MTSVEGRVLTLGIYCFNGKNIGTSKNRVKNSEFGEDIYGGFGEIPFNSCYRIVGKSNIFLKMVFCWIIQIFLFIRGFI
jgi:hypothetical protein